MLREYTVVSRLMGIRTARPVIRLHLLQHFIRFGKQLVSIERRGVQRLNSCVARKLIDKWSGRFRIHTTETHQHSIKSKNSSGNSKRRKTVIRQTNDCAICPGCSPICKKQGQRIISLRQQNDRNSAAPDATSRPPFLRLSHPTFQPSSRTLQMGSRLSTAILLPL